MEYTILKLSKLGGVTTRTLRYYDEIGLLKPIRFNSSGYRIYGQQEVDRLQQILFYRELGVNLEEIITILSSPAFDSRAALRDHRLKLLQKRQQLDLLIANVEQTLTHYEGETAMTNQAKFAGFKQQLIEDNETRYGQEIRAKYGDDTIDKANQQLKGMTEQQFAELEALNQQLHLLLAEAFATGDPAGGPAQQAADLHRQWLGFYWASYSKEAHAGLAQMYVDDPRFTAYYDKQQPGTAEFLRDAVLVYTGMKQGE